MKRKKDENSKSMVKKKRPSKAATNRDSTKLHEEVAKREPNRETALEPDDLHKHGEMMERTPVTNDEVKLITIYREMKNKKNIAQDALEADDHNKQAEKIEPMSMGEDEAGLRVIHGQNRIFSLGHILYVSVILLTLFAMREIGSRETYLVTLRGKTPAYLGLSLVEPNFSNVLNVGDINQQEELPVFLSAYLLQAPNPVALVYLDYLFIPSDPSIPDNVCFKTITMSTGPTIPTQLVSGMNLSDEIDSAIVSSKGQFKYTFADERCFVQGEKYVMPHILLGVIPVDASANFLGAHIRGFRSADYFPFDKQSILFDISVDTDEFVFAPSMEVVLPSGWDVGFVFDSSNTPRLELQRFYFYKWVPIVFLVIMAFIIPLLDTVIRDNGSYYQVMFGLLFGLWGTYELFIPNYLGRSIPIDTIFYLLYFLLIVEILITLVPKLSKKFLKIELHDLNKLDERVVIESLLPYQSDLSGYFLSNHEGSRQFRFGPKIKVGGWFGQKQSRRKIVVWTRKSARYMNEMPSNTTNLFWILKDPIWNQDCDTIFLRDYNDEIIATHSFWTVLGK